MKRSFSFIFLIIPLSLVIGQSTFIERTSPNPAAAQLFFFDRSYNGIASRNWKIATLPASSDYTGDKLLIELFGGNASSSSTSHQIIHLGNRGGFNGYVRTLYGTLISSVRIRAYQQTDGSVDIFLSILSAGWKGASVRVYEGSAITNTRPVIYENPENVGATPAGVLIFDSYEEEPSVQLKNNLDAIFYGNVGIGTTSPSARLSVNGTIRSKEVKVEAAPWPDYVFSEDYDLSSLEETEAYIKANKHLPGIPSAEEISEEGIALGEMNAKLLQKIEELTLHIIDQNKQIAELEAKLDNGIPAQTGEKVEELMLYVIELEKKNRQQDEIIRELLEKPSEP